MSYCTASLTITPQPPSVQRGGHSYEEKGCTDNKLENEKNMLFIYWKSWDKNLKHFCSKLIGISITPFVIIFAVSRTPGWEKMQEPHDGMI